MSLLASTMEALKYTDNQNKLIMSRNLSNAQLAERFGKSIRQIQRQRALLRKMKEEEL